MHTADSDRHSVGRDIKPNEPAPSAQPTGGTVYTFPMHPQSGNRRSDDASFVV